MENRCDFVVVLFLGCALGHVLVVLWGSCGVFFHCSGVDFWGFPRRISEDPRKMMVDGFAWGFPGRISEEFSLRVADGFAWGFPGRISEGKIQL